MELKAKLKIRFGEQQEPKQLERVQAQVLGTNLSRPSPGTDPF